MALHIKALSSKNPQNLTEDSKYIAKSISTGLIDFERLAYLVSNQCTVRESDCYAVLLALEHNMLDELQQGKTVNFGRIGNFKIGVKSNREDTPEEVTVTTIKSAHLNFRASSKLRKKLKSLDYSIKTQTGS
ncbi:DNA-binding protein, histone-like, putative [Lutibacter oricola]|uniref:DNA-binding protein, histone-like, putative n=1 Tax=Lutibacter oricola TaxID=762486 RepID=A0A1H3FSZ2_9FLAO|nr:HU family DNA-binding protein [Lutibacter oricola]SDX93239.1 DNA-binding protein, histone-like, putative [Lutibacter oricola]